MTKNNEKSKFVSKNFIKFYKDLTYIGNVRFTMQFSEIASPIDDYKNGRLRFIGADIHDIHNTIPTARSMYFEYIVPKKRHMKRTLKRLALWYRKKIYDRTKRIASIAKIYKILSNRYGELHHIFYKNAAKYEKEYRRKIAILPIETSAVGYYLLEKYVRTYMGLFGSIMTKYEKANFVSNLVFDVSKYHTKYKTKRSKKYKSIIMKNDGLYKIPEGDYFNEKYEKMSYTDAIASLLTII